MKNTFIIFLVASNLMLGSYVYRIGQSRAFKNFPLDKINIKNDSGILYLFLYFSSKSCLPCLDIIEVLNQLPNHFKVIGLVPESDLASEKELKEATNARFELRSLNKFKKFIPNFAASLIGVSRKGQILFVLPCVPRESSCIEKFLNDFYKRAISLIRS